MSRASPLWIAAALAFGCVALPHPTAADAERARATWPGADQASLAAGRARFVEKCAGCHALPLPRRYPADEWPAWVAAMADGARLEPAERALIEQYLVTMAGRPDAG